MLYCITKCIIFIILKIFFKIEILGRENIPKKGAFILASNHSSFLDPPILSAGCFHRRLNFLAKDELFFNRVFAWYIRRLGAFPLRRGRTDISSIKESIKRIRKGETLVIFPEGGRSKDGRIREGLPGIAMLCTKENIPVIPAFIKDSDRALGSDLKSLRFCKIYLKFGKPLFFYKTNKESYLEITDRIMSAIEQLSH